MSLGVGPDTFADSLEDFVNTQVPLVNMDIPEHYGRMASFVYYVDDKWYEDHGYDVKIMPPQVHIQTDMYSNFFNAIAWTNLDDLPDEFAEWKLNPWENRVQHILRFRDKHGPVRARTLPRRALHAQDVPSDSRKGLRHAGSSSKLAGRKRGRVGV